MTAEHLHRVSADQRQAGQLQSGSLWSAAIICLDALGVGPGGGVEPWAQKLCKHVNQPETRSPTVQQRQD